MSELVANCPRCTSKTITFDVKSYNFAFTQHKWQRWYELFCVCRHCSKSTVFIVSQREIKIDPLRTNGLKDIHDSINNYYRIEDFINIKNITQEKPPEYIPKDIEAIFKEGAACLSINCFNAASTMFRLCLDKATHTKLPEENENGLNNKIRRSLGLRLIWLFEQNLLPNGLEELASCIKDDGNDGAHQGILGKDEAEDILDFTFILLERLYTEPKRVELAKERREKRHQEAT